MTTKDEKKVIIEKLCSTLKISILNNLNILPEDWEDLELRQYLNDKALLLNQVKMTRTRMHIYKDYVEKYKL